MPHNRAPILWIVPKWPLPAVDGARIATSQLLSRLSRLWSARHRPTELAVFATEAESTNTAELVAEAKQTLGVHAVHFIPSSDPRQGLSRAPGLLRSVLMKPWTPLTMSRYTNAVARARFAELATRPWSAWVYDGLHGAGHAESGGDYVRPAGDARLIYRAHNVESQLWSRKAELSGLSVIQLVFSWQARRVNQFEESLIAAASAVATVSSNDSKSFSARCPQARVRMVPIGYEFGEQPPFPSVNTPAFMFIGRLDWAPNREGLDWFLRNVWPRAIAKRPDLKLEIAGSGHAEWLDTFLREHRSTGVRFLGRVLDVTEIYRRSCVSIVPLFYGSGTRVKVIEAARYGRACLSTALGVEGTGLIASESFLQAETVDEWVQALVEFDPHRAASTGQSAFKQLKQTFDADQAAQTFAELIDD